MLTTITPAAPDAGTAAILAALGGGRETETIVQGIFLIPHFNGKHILPGKWEEWPKLHTAGRDPFEAMSDDNWTNCYGVCDDVQQLLDRCPMLVNDPDREFAITLTEVRRDEQPSEGGWRWHKWGPYIGAHDPQCEYLYDEVGIERVLFYQVFERKRGELI